MIFSNKKPFVIAALIACGAVGARAQGMYIGGAIGTPDYSSNVNGIGGGGGGSGTGLKLYGGYKLGPNFAIEGGLFSLGQTSDANGSVDTRGVYLDAVADYKLAPQWSVLGSVGVAQGNFSTDLGNDTSPALKLGAGIQYDLTPKTALRLQYDRYSFVNAFGDKPAIGELTLGVNFGF